MTRTAILPRRRLRNRLMLAFAGFTLLVAALFALYVVLFVYTVEDQLFETMLDREVAAQQAYQRDHGRWATPRDGFMSIVPSMAALPDGIAEVLREEPRRREFAGAEGRHYHLRVLQSADANAPPAWLVAEVSALLVVRPMRAQMLQLLAWSGVAMVAMALLLGGWLARRTTAPLSRLAEAVGDATPERLPPGFAASFPDDEVGVVARRLDDLIAQVRDFVEREREFTRDASHELRTPLTVVRVAIDTMLDDPETGTRARRTLLRMQRAGRDMEAVIDAFLILAREHDAAALAEDFDVAEIVADQADKARVRLQDKAVDLQVVLHAAPRLHASPRALAVILDHLLENACAFTDQGRVEVTLEADRIVVSDTGIGMSPATLQRVYEPFYRADQFGGGKGMGLSIVRRLGERFGWPVTLDSVPGVGTTATIGFARHVVAGDD